MDTLAERFAGHVGYGWGWGGPSAWIWGVGVLLVLAALVAAATYLVRRTAPRQHATPAPQPNVHTEPTSSAQRVLAERFARGELTAEEYRAKIAVLRESGSEQ